MARVVLNGSRTDDELDPLTVDLVLNEERRVVQKFATMGWWGSLGRENELEPFVFLPDGRLDFGSGWEDAEERYAGTNLLSKCIATGEYVTVTNNDGDHCFVVKQVLWMDDLPVGRGQVISA